MANVTSEVLVRAPPRIIHKDVNIPSFLRWLYKTGAYERAAMGQNVLGILGFDGFPSQADLTQFMTRFREDGKTATFTVVEANGRVYYPNYPSEAANIYTQYSAAMVYPTPLIFYSAGNTFKWDLQNDRPAPGDAYLAWFNYIFNAQNIPPTISIMNANPESGLPPEYARALCVLFAQLGARGVSVLVSSGDDGVGPGDCKDSSGNVQFIPMFPASCPWVTSVGGTMGRRRAEVAASFSGGGFSNYFLLPEYQTSAVHVFRRLLGNKYAGCYQLEGRGIPDIAAHSDDFAYISDSVLKSASSTACSTPVVAAIFSLVNDYYLSKGTEPLGFLNILLYAFRFTGLVDITQGSNPGCDTDGFPATIGWDPATGLGTPGFEKLLKALDELAPPSVPSQHVPKDLP